MFQLSPAQRLFLCLAPQPDGVVVVLLEMSSSLDVIGYLLLARGMSFFFFFIPKIPFERRYFLFLVEL